MAQPAGGRDEVALVTGNERPEQAGDSFNVGLGDQEMSFLIMWANKAQMEVLVKSNRGLVRISDFSESGEAGRLGRLG
jgi:hypothetical protein